MKRWKFRLTCQVSRLIALRLVASWQWGFVHSPPSVGLGGGRHETPLPRPAGEGRSGDEETVAVVPKVDA